MLRAQNDFSTNQMRWLNWKDARKMTEYYSCMFYLELLELMKGGRKNSSSVADFWEKIVLLVQKMILLVQKMIPLDTDASTLLLPDYLGEAAKIRRVEVFPFDVTEKNRLKNRVKVRSRSDTQCSK
mmetsp:Transcript_11681/g.19331  ORF Transcript_11681/g.19331 Transcript_11681/m.19331 type:complete len:126 (-) Transcript_11681:90-467(-)